MDIRKILVLISLLLVSNLIISQEKYSLYINDLCDGDDSHINCTLDGVDGKADFDTIKKSFFIVNGKYNLTVMLERGKYFSIYSQIINISSKSDTINFGKIHMCSEFDNITNGGFCYCDELCNGYCIDYYPDGNKRIEGEFKKGIPIGKLIYYGKNGYIDYIQKYSRKGKLKKTINYPVSVPSLSDNGNEG